MAYSIDGGVRFACRRQASLYPPYKFYDGNHQKFYWNGDLVELADNSGKITQSKKSFLIGALNHGQSPYFSGKIDDVRIYNRALTHSEIKQLAGIVPSCDVVKDGLVGCYPFDGNANDGSGKGNHGIVNGTTLTTDRAGNVDNAYQFSGESWLEAPDSSSLDSPTNAVSISMWIYADAFPELIPIPTDEQPNKTTNAFDLLISKGSTWSSWKSGHRHYSLFVRYDGVLHFKTDPPDVSGSNTNGSYSLPLKKWVHLVVMANTENDGQHIFYVNGEEKLRKTSLGFSTFQANNDPLYIGSAPPMGYQTQRDFQGILDNIRIYNRTLSEAEIQTLYNLGQTDDNRLTVNKTGEGRGTLRAKQKGEDWNFVCKSACTDASDIYPVDSQIILTASPAKGFLFSGWSGDCTGTNKRLTFTMDAAKTCTAQFERDPNLTWHQLTVNLGGTGNGNITASGLNCTQNSCTVFYQQDEVVRLKATRALFSEFVGWTGDCEGTKTVKLTMTEDLTCTAEFKSKFEILVEQTLEAFYANATLDNGELAATQYPQTADNQVRLKEAFWLNIAALMQTDQHLGLSQTQAWPIQMNGIEWLPSDFSRYAIPIWW
jgi:uncharacterized repeat protein (TIGR02543 family)